MLCLHSVPLLASGVQVELLDVGEDQLDRSHLELVGSEVGHWQSHALDILFE
jgi:hypothetical protein